MAHNGASIPGGAPASGRPRSRSENRQDIILVPSSPDLPPMAALSSMPPPATTTPSASQFSMRAFSFSSSPSLPSRTIETSPGKRMPIPKEIAPQIGQARNYVALDSSPDTAARTDSARHTAPPPNSTRSAYFVAGESSSSQTGGNNEVEPVVESAKTEAVAAARRPGRYEAGDLVQAVERRRDWTPPPADTASHLEGNSVVSVDKWSSPKEPAGSGVPALMAMGTRSDIFKTLHEDFNCSESSKQTVAAAAPLELFFANRKPIQAVSIGAGRTSSKSPTKAAPKKKPRTLTELAMAAYADPSMEGDEEEEASVAQTDLPKKRGRPKRQLEVVEENGGEPPTQPAVVRPGFPTTKLRKLQSSAAAATTPDGKKIKKPRKKPAPRTKKQTVLSPESARAESMRQDFLFGTSSQLAADESPTFLRQLHAAMQDSNDRRGKDGGSGDDDEKNPLMDLFDDAGEINLTAVGSIKPRSGREVKLWGAAWRGEDGRVALEHVIDLEGDEAAAFPEDPHQVLAMAQRAAAEQAKDVDQADDVGLVGASKIVKAGKAGKAGNAKIVPKRVSQTQPAELSAPVPSLALKPVANAGNKILPATPSPAKAREKTQGQTHIPSPTQSALLALMSPARQGAGDLAAGVSDVSAPALAAAATATATANPRPNFEVLSTAQLSSKVSSYGYKPVKVRSAMVALLNQCWDAKNVTQTGHAASFSTTSAVASPVKAKAKKAPAKSTATATSPETKTRKRTATATKTAKTTKASSKTTGTTSPTRVTKPKKTPVKKAVGKKATAAKSSKQPGPPVFEIQDSDASDDGRLSSPEVPCSVASDASLAYDSDIIVDEMELVGDMESSDAEMDETLSAEPTCEEARLFKLITEAVTTAPSSTDPEQPSWHEKMLMYDTIILEEFTEWANSVLGAANEVTALQAKKWCESKSVCCTWRKNARGKERKL